MSENKVENVIILGGGPAGYTAALYASRANLDPLVIEGFQWGGQLQNTTDVENYPGYPEGIMGPEMMNQFRAQAERFGTRFITDDADRVELSDGGLQKVFLGDEEHVGKTIILAMGAEPRRLGLPGEMELSGRGVSTCGVCDGAFFKDEEVMVIGGGDSAMEEAMYLTKFASKVTVIHRRHELRASRIMQDRAFANAKIAWIWNTVIEDIVGTQQGGVTAVKLHNKRTGLDSEYPTQGVFYAIGHKPNTEIFKGKLEMNDIGYIQVRDPSTKTNVPGVFACGDASDPIYRQAITAAGTGCRAAMDAEHWLQELHD
jgi:thioredoxin reductase (NADPH)